MNICRSCGETMRDDLDFCPNCKTQNYPYSAYILVNRITGEVLKHGAIVDVAKTWGKLPPNLDIEVREIEVMEIKTFKPSELAGYLR